MGVPDVYRALWQRKLLVLALTCVAVGVAFALVSRQQKVYKASVLVRVQQRITDPAEAFGALQTGGRLAQTYARIVGTRTIAHKVQKEMRHRVPLADVAGAISASQVDDLELLSISASAASPGLAAELANATPEALRDFIMETGTLRDQVITVEPAVPPSSPSSPRLKLDLVVAFLLGLIFNSGLVLVLEAWSDRVRDSEELERLTGKPVLTAVPSLELLTVSKLGWRVPGEVGLPRGRGG